MICNSKQYTIPTGDIQTFNSINVCCILPRSVCVCAATTSRVKHRYLLLFMTRKWKVKWEPPYPFGKTHQILEASSRLEAIEQVKQSGVVSAGYKVTASPAKESN